MPLLSPEDSAEPPTNLPEFPTLDERFAAVDVLAPGFAGLYNSKDSDGTVVIAVTPDAVSLDQIVAAIGRVFSPRFLEGKAVVTREVEYRFSHLATWRQSAHKFFNRPDFTMLGIDEVRNRIVIGMLDLSAVPDYEEALVQLGVPLEAVIFVEAGFPQPD